MATVVALICMPPSHMIGFDTAANRLDGLDSYADLDRRKSVEIRSMLDNPDIEINAAEIEEQAKLAAREEKDREREDFKERKMRARLSQAEALTV